LVTLAGAVVNVEIKNVPTETGYDPSQRIAIDVATILARTAVSARTSVSARTAVSARTNALARMTVAARMASARTMKPELGPTDVVVSSFSPDTLAAVGDADRVAARLPDRDWAAGGAAPLGLLVHPAWDALSALEAATGLRCAALHPHHSQVTAELVRRAHGLGVAVITWTVNDPGELDAVVEAGVDAVITDRVAETLSHLGRPAPN
jgi:glycerophosphoryl diester phosphodiesterase